MDAERLRAGFILGIKIAEYIHGVKREIRDLTSDPKTDAMFQALKEVANGSLTLLGTEAEVRRELSQVSEKPGNALTKSLRIARENDKIIATEIMKTFPDDLFENV